MPSRRQFLAGVAAAGVPLAGCTDLADSGATYSPGTDGTTEWRFPDADRRSTGHVPDAAAPRDGVSRRWRVSIPGGNGRPVVADGTAFVPTVDGLLALDLDSGDRRWSFGPSDQPWAAPPTVRDGTVYAGFATERGLWALDAATGDPRWSLDTRGTVEAAVLPSRNGDRLYAGDDTGRVYVVAADGSVEHTYDVIGAVTALAGGGTTTVVGTNGGQVYELYRDGRAFYPLWRRRVAGGVQDVAVDDGGSVVVSVFGDYVYKLQNGTHAGTDRWRAEFTANDFVATRSHVVGTNLSRLSGIGGRDGERLWSRSGNFGCAPAGAGDSFYAGAAYDGDDAGGYVAAYPLAGGDGLLSDAPDPRWKRDLSGVPTGGLAVADGALFVPVRRRDDADRLYAFDPA